jgi:hypothetical protein
VANVPGTEIEKPTVDLTDAVDPFQKIHKVQRALRRAGVPEENVRAFCAAGGRGVSSLFDQLPQAIADYVEVAE